MPALVFPAPGFTTSTKFTSTFSTFLVYIPGKVAPRSNINSPVDKRTVGKVATISSIKSPTDKKYIAPATITKFKVNSVSSINNLLTVNKLSSMAELVADATNYKKYTAPATITKFKVNSVSSINNLLTVNKLSSMAELVADLTKLRVNKLGSLSKLTTTGLTQSTSFAPRVDQFYNQSGVFTQQPPTNARETLYYANLAPGIRVNSSIIQGYLIAGNLLPTNLGSIKQPQSNFVDISTKLIKSGQLQNPIIKLYYNTANFNTGNLKSTSKLTEHSTDFRKIELLVNPFKVKSKDVQFFETPLSSKLVSITTLKTDKNRFTIDKLSSTAVIRAITTNFNNENINKFIFLKASDSVFNNENINKFIFLKATDSKLRYEEIRTFKIHSDQTEIFETPLSGNVKPFSYNLGTFNDLALNTGKLISVATLKTDKNRFTIDKLSSTAILREHARLAQAYLLDKFKVPFNATNVFYTPILNKLSAVAVMRSDNSKLTTDNLKAAAVIREDGNSKKLYKLNNFDNYINQDNVRPTSTPKNASERFYYFNLAPGFRRNLSIQQGIVFAPINNIIKNYRLELFDNVDYQIGSAEYYPREKVKTTVAPTNAREALYYAELSPGIRTNRTISYGISFVGEILTTPIISTLAKDIWKLRELVGVKNSDGQIFKFIVGDNKPGSVGFIDTTRKPTISTLTKDIWKLRELVGVKDSNGRILKFITGDNKKGSTGFIDTAVKKKEPIQFWN